MARGDKWPPRHLLIFLLFAHGSPARKHRAALAAATRHPGRESLAELVPGYRRWTFDGTIGTAIDILRLRRQPRLAV